MACSRLRAGGPKIWFNHRVTWLTCSSIQLFLRTQDFVHTYCNGGRSQRTQTKNHAQDGNVQILKNNIDREGYQPVAESGLEVRRDGDFRFRQVSLRRGGSGQCVQALLEPAEIEPGE